MTNRSSPPWWSLARWFGSPAGVVSQPDALRSESGAAPVVDEVIALCAAEQLERAEDAVRAALAGSPADRRLYEVLGAVQFKRGAVLDAAGSLREAMRLGPPDARTANFLGLCHLFAGQSDEAAESFRRATEIDSNYADSYANLGWLSLASGDTGEMYRCLRKWLSVTLSASDPWMPGTGDRLDLSRVTLCCIDCAYQDLAIHALTTTLAKCRFAQTLFFTDKDYSLDGIRVVKIEKIASTDAYSNFVIHQLFEYIETEFVLIIQYDGFVLHPGAWDDEFFNYDYIGAKILLKDGYVVGNGGFSLRSRRLLAALQDQAIKSYDARNDGWQEDMAICVMHREYLETKFGIRFAPGELAEKFSADATVPGPGNFGFHHLIHLVELVANGFEDSPHQGSNRVTFTVKAVSPIGEFRASKRVTIRGSSAFDRAVSRRF